MALTSLRMESLLAYCRMEDPTQAERLSLREAYETAVAYLEGAGISEPEENDDQFPLWLRCVKALVLDEIDQRGAQVESGSLADNPAFQRMKNQLKLGASQGLRAQEGGSPWV